MHSLIFLCLDWASFLSGRFSKLSPQFQCVFFFFFFILRSGKLNSPVFSFRNRLLQLTSHPRAVCGETSDITMSIRPGRKPETKRPLLPAEELRWVCVAGEGTWMGGETPVKNCGEMFFQHEIKVVHVSVTIANVLCLSLLQWGTLLRASASLDHEVSWKMCEKAGGLGAGRTAAGSEGGWSHCQLPPVLG